MSKQDVLADPVWANYPRLRHLATYMLYEEEAENLRNILLKNDPSVNIRDWLNLDTALRWRCTPQGHLYWLDVHDRIYNAPMPKYDPDALVDHGETVGETEAGWQPDIVNGASVMDITRSLF